MNVQLEDIYGKREAILSSTLALVREHGFHGTPMSLIARKAGVAAGTIYHYFDSKEALMDALYEYECKKLASVLMVGDQESAPYKQRFFGCMMNQYHYYINNENSLYFLEQYTYSPYAKKYPAKKMDKQFEDILNFFEFGRKNKFIKDIDSRFLTPTIKGTLIAAANFQLTQHMVFSDEDIMEVLQIIWDGIKNT